MGHHAQVVGDHQVGQAVSLTQGAQQVQDFGLHRHVQRRGGLVQQQDARLQDQRTGNRHALALATRQLVRVAVTVAGVQPHLGQDGVHPVGHIRHAVDTQGLGQRGEHGVAWMQGTIRVLEHHLHLAAALPVGLFAQRLAGDVQRPVPVGELACKAAQHGGLAGAGLTDQAKRLAGLNGKRNIVQNLDGVRALAKAEIQRLDFDHGHGGRSPQGFRR